jgi:Na+-transporting NADH:ubiquinone oxidoreductase subunit NqrB
VIFLTGDAWISPGQWGSGIVILFAVMSLGFIVVTRVQKLDVSLAFLGTFGLLLFVRQIIYLGWPMDFFIQSISTGSLLLFSFFMITDPRTTPNHAAARIIWAMAVAAVSFYLATFKFMNGAPIWVLVMAQPLVPILDKIFRAGTFQWKPAKQLTPKEQHFLQSVYTHAVM